MNKISHVIIFLLRPPPLLSQRSNSTSSSSTSGVLFLSGWLCCFCSGSTFCQFLERHTRSRNSDVRCGSTSSVYSVERIARQRFLFSAGLTSAASFSQTSLLLDLCDTQKEQTLSWSLWPCALRLSSYSGRCSLSNRFHGNRTLVSAHGLASDPSLSWLQRLFFTT